MMTYLREELRHVRYILLQRPDAKSVRLEHTETDHKLRAQTALMLCTRRLQLEAQIVARVLHAQQEKFYLNIYTEGFAQNARAGNTKRAIPALTAL